MPARRVYKKNKMNHKNNLEFIKKNFSSEKKCKKCQKVFERSLKFFHANDQHSDGLHIYCKICRNEAKKKSY